MAEEKKAEKNMAEKEVFQHLAEYANGRISIGSNGRNWPLTRARFSPLDLDSASFTV
jgi:hypothetical protein